MGPLRTAYEYRRRAVEARALAKTYSPEVGATLFEIALNYDALATAAEIAGRRKITIDWDGWCGPRSDRNLN